MSYRVTGSVPRTLAGGKPVAPGDLIPDGEAEKNPRLIDRGVLRKVAAAKKAAPKKASEPEPKAPMTEEAE